MFSLLANTYAPGSSAVPLKYLMKYASMNANSGDSKGHMNITVNGSNSGYYFCGGKAEPITWKKDGTYAPFTFYHADGTPLSLQTGHTYVCVIGLRADLTYNG